MLQCVVPAGYPIPVHSPDVRRPKDSITNAIVNRVTVGRVKTVAHLGAISNQPECRLLRQLQGARARTIGFDISDGYFTRKSLSVFDVQLPRAFEDHLVALGASSEETRTLHAQAFVKLNGAKLVLGKRRQNIVTEHADLPEVLVLRRGLKVRTRTTETRHCRCDIYLHTL